MNKNKDAAEALEGKRIAILVANGFEQVEMTDPKLALEEAGARTDIISPEDGTVRGWQHVEWGDLFDVDVPLEEAVRCPTRIPPPMTRSSCREAS